MDRVILDWSRFAVSDRLNGSVTAPEIARERDPCYQRRWRPSGRLSLTLSVLLIVLELVLVIDLWGGGILWLRL